MDYQKLYQEKSGTVQDAYDLLKPGDFISAPGYGCEPTAFFKSLHTVADRCPGIHVKPAGRGGAYDYVKTPEIAAKFALSTSFHNDHSRYLSELGLCEFTPYNLHSVHELGEGHTGIFFVGACSPMDEDGNFHFGCDAQMTLASLARADRVVLEVNKYIPTTYGENAVNIKDVTLIYENDAPIAEPVMPPIGDTERGIAEYVVDLVNDGDTIQLGIGAMPNAVGEGLMCKHDLGIHTEMMTASMGAMMRAGVVTNQRKNFNTGKTVVAFMFGDRALYDFADHNRDIELHPASYINEPYIIAKNDNMVSINTALQVDLTGQICSESIGYKQYSGAGGAFDFAYGAFCSKGGKGIIALSSTAKKGTVSRIAPVLSPGAAVTIPRNIADYVITEYGVAKLRGKSVRQRAEALIEVSHPAFREELRAEARKMMYI